MWWQRAVTPTGSAWHCCCCLVLQSTRLPLPELAKLAYKTALGMAYLHRVGVVHFNLKCSSLLSFPEGRPAPCIRTSDMRLARFKQDQVDLTNMRFGAKAW
jgi:serine/threonine protein kinase